MFWSNAPTVNDILGTSYCGGFAFGPISNEACTFIGKDGNRYASNLFSFGTRGPVGGHAVVAHTIKVPRPLRGVARRFLQVVGGPLNQRNY